MAAGQNFGWLGRSTIRGAQCLDAAHTNTLFRRQAQFLAGIPVPLARVRLQKFRLGFGANFFFFFSLELFGCGVAASRAYSLHLATLFGVSLQLGKHPMSHFTYTMGFD